MESVFNFIVQWIKDNPQWVAVFLGALLEFYLGKTKRVESNSILEIILRILLRRKL